MPNAHRIERLTREALGNPEDNWLLKITGIGDFGTYLLLLVPLFAIAEIAL